MDTKRSAILLLLFLILCSSNVMEAKQSDIHLTNNGYSTVLVALHPQTPPHPNLVKHLVDFLRDGSRQLLASTRRRAYLKDVDVVLPSAWTDADIRSAGGGVMKLEPNGAGRRRFDAADIRVAPLHPRHGGPGTPSFVKELNGECGAFGEFLQLTPDFLNMPKEEREKKVGDAAKLFVHEWAHLRWGLKDEYPDEGDDEDEDGDPDDRVYFSTQTKKYEATRCALAIGGRFVRRNEATSSWIQCEISSEGKLDKGCVFAPGYGQFDPDFSKTHPEIRPFIALELTYQW